MKDGGGSAACRPRDKHRGTPAGGGGGHGCKRARECSSFFACMDLLDPERGSIRSVCVRACVCACAQAYKVRVLPMRSSALQGAFCRSTRCSLLRSPGPHATGHTKHAAPLPLMPHSSIKPHQACSSPNIHAPLLPLASLSTQITFH